MLVARILSPQLSNSARDESKRFWKPFPIAIRLPNSSIALRPSSGPCSRWLRPTTIFDKFKESMCTKAKRFLLRLDQELSEDVFAITYRRNHREHWEPEFVSVIDSRGSKAFRAYFTKWHELAHLLTLTDQLRLSFRRTHVARNFNSPEEALMEVIAGHFGFYAPLRQTARIRHDLVSRQSRRYGEKLCPEASQQSALIGIVKAWPIPCLLVNARLATKKGAALQRDLFPSNGSVASLRAVHVTVNEAARQDDLAIFENMRVPETSIIYRVFQGMPSRRGGGKLIILGNE